MTKKATTTKRGRGRPPVDNPASVRLNVRVTPEDRAKYHRAAKRAGLPLAAWLKYLADSAAAM